MIFLWKQGIVLIINMPENHIETDAFLTWLQLTSDCFPNVWFHALRLLSL